MHESRPQRTMAMLQRGERGNESFNYIQRRAVCRHRARCRTTQHPAAAAPRSTPREIQLSSMIHM